MNFRIHIIAKKVKLRRYTNFKLNWKIFILVGVEIILQCRLHMYGPLSLIADLIAAAIKCYNFKFWHGPQKISTGSFSYKEYYSGAFRVQQNQISILGQFHAQNLMPIKFCCKT